MQCSCAPIRFFLFIYLFIFKSMHIHHFDSLFAGKSTLACALSRALHLRGKLAYILDGDNIRHGLNSDLSFKAEDRAENIRRIGMSLGVHVLQILFLKFFLFSSNDFLLFFPFSFENKGEVAKLFADAGIICIASLISPYRKDREACRSLLPEGDFIEVFDTLYGNFNSRHTFGLSHLHGEVKYFKPDRGSLY